MTAIDFDALEGTALDADAREDAVSMRPQTLLALIALARRTEEAERECAAEREAALHAERERDEARAALAKACAQIEPIAQDDGGGYISRRSSATVRRKLTAIVEALRKAAAGASARPPLDPAHVEVVQYIRDRLAREAAKLRGDGFTYLANERDREVAHLEVVLGEAKAVGQRLSDGGTTEES